MDLAFTSASELSNLAFYMPQQRRADKLAAGEVVNSVDVMIVRSTIVITSAFLSWYNVFNTSISPYG